MPTGRPWLREEAGRLTRAGGNMLDLPAAGGRHDVPPVAAACGGNLAATHYDAERFSMPLRARPGFAVLLRPRRPDIPMLDPLPLGPPAGRATENSLP